MSILFRIVVIFLILLSLGGRSQVTESAPNKQACVTSPTFVAVNRKRTEHNICANFFKLFYFPVIVDNRSYTIEIIPLDGDVDLYASRFKQDVDSLKRLKNFNCKGHEHFCDISLGTGSRIEAVTFSAPEPPKETKGYNSWFAVYAKENAMFSVRVISAPKGVIAIAWNSLDTYNIDDSLDQFYEHVQAFSGENAFINNALKSVVLPDTKWGCGSCAKHYLGVFGAKKVTPINVAFSSDDSLWLILNNGTYSGYWGSGPKEAGCINTNNCGTVHDVAPLSFSNELFTKQANIINVQVANVMQDQLFNLIARRDTKSDIKISNE